MALVSPDEWSHGRPSGEQRPPSDPHYSRWRATAGHSPQTPALPGSTTSAPLVFHKLQAGCVQWHSWPKPAELRGVRAVAGRAGERVGDGGAREGSSGAREGICGEGQGGGAGGQTVVGAGEGGSGTGQSFGWPGEGGAGAREGGAGPESVDAKLCRTHRTSQCPDVGKLLWDQRHPLISFWTHSLTDRPQNYSKLAVVWWLEHLPVKGGSGV